MIDKTYEEELEISYKFYDTIDFTKFIDDNEHTNKVKDIMCKLEDYYDFNHPESLPEEFEGCFFNFVDEYDFVLYLKKRYPDKYDVTSEVIENYYIHKKYYNKEDNT